jgi:hypothetical protein
MRGTKHHQGFITHTLQRFQKPVPPLLIEANRLFGEGNYDQAASIYERLAKTANDRQDPRAPLLFLQSGRAHYLAQENAFATALIHQGISLLAEQGRWVELNRFGSRVLQGMKLLRLDEEADEFRNWMEVSFSEFSGDSHGLDIEVEKPLQPGFPIKCPSCGAPLNSAEIDWVTDSTAECLFCGSIVRGDIV